MKTSKTITTPLCGILIAFVSVAQAAEPSATRPIDLRCEGKADPLGIDAQPPAFSWRMEDERRGARQTAYRILAASSPEKLAEDEADLWDSGKVASDRSQWVVWDGPALNSRQRVYWKVMLWDAEEKPTAWSEPASFELGLLEPSDWQSSWLQGPESKTRFEGEAMEFIFDHLFLDGPRNRFKFKDDTGGGRIPKAQALVREKTHPAAVFRREFTLDSVPQSARLYLCGLGNHRVFINGRMVNTGRGVPSISQYPLGSYYQTLDVTDFLMPGANAVAVTVALGRYHELHKPFGDRTSLIAQLEAVMDDGTSVVVGTGPDWKMSADGPLRGSQFHLLELYDARLEGNFSEAGFDDGEWAAATVLPEAPTARLTCEIVPPSRALETIEPASSQILAPGVTLLDFGRQISGHVRLRITGAEPGTPVMIRYYEALWPWDDYPPKGLPNWERNEWIAFICFPHYDAYDGAVVKGLPIMRRRGTGVPIGMHASIIESDAYISAGRAEETWESSFNANAFKYAEIIVPSGAEVKVEAVAVVTHNDVPLLGEFHSASSLYNDIWRAGLSTALYNYQDGTTLDNLAYERGSFPNNISANHGNMMSLDMQAIQRRQMTGLRWWGDAGMNEGKPITTMVDTLRFVDVHKAPFPHVSITHSRFFVELPYFNYLYYGDPRVPLRLRSDSEKFLRFWTEAPEVIEDGGFFRTDPWGDHVGPGSQYGNTSKRVKRLLPADIYHAITLAQLLSQYQTLAQTLGFADEPVARHFAKKLDEVRAAIDDRCFDQQKGAYVPADSVTIQSANALPLAWGLAPEGAEDSMVEAIVADIENWNGHQSTGWYATRELFDVLSRHGRIDEAARLMSRTEYPSFGKMVAAGFGTLHEYWGLPNSPFPARGALMQNEGNVSACAWFPQSLAGIRPSFEGPGFKRFTIEPQIPAGLAHAAYRYQSPHGEIVSDWKKEEHAIRFIIQVPPNSQCDFFLPAPAGAQVTEGGKPLKQAPLVAVGERIGDRLHLKLPAGRYAFGVRK